MKSPIKISVIVPCYNEEMKVAGVLRDLLKIKTIYEVIAVNDGSTDGTLKVLNTFNNKIRIVSYKKNKGKGNAMAEGIKKAKGEIIVFMDAHLENLNSSHLNSLTYPLIRGQADITLGSQLGRYDPLIKITGQRAYWRKDIVPLVTKMSKERYGVEVYLNHSLRRKRIKMVRLKGMKHLLKHEKMPLSQMPSQFWNEGVEIAKTLAKINGLDYKDLRSTKKLKIVLKKVKDKEIFLVLKKYISSDYWKDLLDNI